MDLSKVIVDSMKHINKKLENINPDSVNRSKVRSKINISIVCWANELIVLPKNEREIVIDSIYRKCLASELFK